MHAHRFDRLSQAVAGRFSRRQAIAQGGAGLAATALATGGRACSGRAAAAAQTTPATPVSPEGGATPKLLFIQDFQAGGFEIVPGETDVYTLTLERGPGSTVYFSDRPDRTWGAMPTERFVRMMDFNPANPPNAGLVFQVGMDAPTPEADEIVIMELTLPTYDPTLHTATYRAQVLADWAHLDVVFHQRPKGNVELPGRFGAAHLFIDSGSFSPQFGACCPEDVWCVKGTSIIASFKHRQCHSCGSGNLWCDICIEDDLDEYCNDTYAACAGGCFAQGNCNSAFGC